VLKKIKRTPLWEYTQGLLSLTLNKYSWKRSEKNNCKHSGGGE